MVGLINGIGVAYLRIPSMVLTLGINALLKGVIVVYTGSAPQFQQAPPILELAVAPRCFGGILPVAVIVWAMISLMNYLVLSRSTLGRKTYAVGNNELRRICPACDTPRVLIGGVCVKRRDERAGRFADRGQCRSQLQRNG